MLRSRLRCLSPPLAILVGVILGLTLSSLLHHPSSSSLSSLSSSRTLSDPMLLDDVANMRDRIRELEEQLRTALGSSDRAATSSRRNIRAPGEPSTGLLPPPVAPLVLTDPAAFIAEHPDSNPAPVRVCLVTSAFSGPTLNGGIATAFFSLAKHMVASRQPGGRNREFKVTVLYAAHPYYAVGNAEKWRETFAAAGIDFVPLPEPETKFYGAKLVIRSYRVFEYLRTHENEFDVISYHDHMGNGYFAALAKHQNLAFANTMLVVQGHSTMRWADIGNHRPPKDHNSLAYYFMEQKSIEYADARVSPSQYYLEWMRDEGRYDLSHGLSFVVQNTLFPLAADEQIVKLHKSRHFVFFGRLEVRKGLLIFCDALDQLVADSQTSGEQALPKTVTFLGPDTSIDGERAVSILRKRMDQGKWPFKVAIELAFDSFRALKYIKDHNAIAVLPTLGDNSPYVVMELIAHNLPMITTDAGGGEELIAKDTGFAHEPVVVPAGDAVALAASMSYAMASGIHNVHMSSSFTQTRDTYLQLFHAFRALSIKRRANRADHPPGGRVTVGITSHNRPDSLVATVNSILHQTYPSRLIRVVIVDDASDHPLMNATFADISNKLAKAGIQYQLVQMPKHTFVAESRNLIFQMAVESDSDYACLMDDDDAALPYMVAVYMRVATATDSDVLTDFSDNYDVDKDGKPILSHRSIAIGNAFAHNFFINNYGKANFCVKPKRALQIGGHQTGPQSNSPYVDWGFFTRAALHDLKMELIPFALYKYTKYSQNSIWYGMRSQIDRFNGHGKMLRDMNQEVPEKFWDVLRYCRYRLGIPRVVGDGLA